MKKEEKEEKEEHSQARLRESRLNTSDTYKFESFILVNAV